MDINKLGFFLRTVPNFIPGRSRMMRWLTKHIVDTGIAEFEVDEFYYQVPSLKEPVAFSLWSSGAYEPEIQEMICTYWEDGTCFIDVGANIGAL